MGKFATTARLVGLAALAAAAAPAAAENVTADPKVIAQALQSGGYRAEIKQSEGGEPYVSSASSGYTFSIDFYGCKNAELKCTSLQFYALFTPDGAKPTLEQINLFSSQYRYGRAYLDKDGNPLIEFDLELHKGGMSQELFLENVANWDVILETFGDRVFDIAEGKAIPAK